MGRCCCFFVFYIYIYFYMHNSVVVSCEWS